MKESLLANTSISSCLLISALVVCLQSLAIQIALASTVSSTNSHSIRGRVRQLSHTERLMQDRLLKFNDTDRPEKVPVQPVFCARAEPVQSALLVRLVGNPSLITRYERLTVERIVVESYSDWMSDACDGFHRLVHAAELLPVYDEPVLSEVHKESWRLEQQGLQSNATSTAISSNDAEEGVEVQEQLENVTETQSNRSDYNTLTVNASSTLGPTNIEYSYGVEAIPRNQPLHWLKLSGTCRNCPMTEHGNSNLLKSHAGRAVNSIIPTEISADDLILEEVCFCTLNKNDMTRGDNETLTEFVTPVPVDRFFPDAKAPSSMDLLRLINTRIQDLHAVGLLHHVKALLQLTEPDYAYYALEMEGNIAATSGTISTDGDETTNENNTTWHYEGTTFTNLLPAIPSNNSSLETSTTNSNATDMPAISLDAILSSIHSVQDNSALRTVAPYVMDDFEEPQSAAFCDFRLFISSCSILLPFALIAV